MNVEESDTGIVRQGISVARQSWNEEREDDFVDARAHVVRRVVGYDPLEVVRERLLELRHRLAYRLHRRDGVRARLLLERDRDGVASVELAGEHVVLFADFGARDVLEPHDAAVRVTPHDDIVELLRGHEAPLREERHRPRGVVACRRGADRAERGLDVLLRDGGHHLLGVHSLRGHARGVEPDAHRELRTVHRRVAHALDAQEHRLDVRVDVVRDLQSREGSVGGPDRDEAEHVRVLRAHALAELLHLRRKLRLRLGDAVLDLDLVHVSV